MSPVYYNEFCRGAAEWLRELMRAGLIPEGVIDERDIREVRGEDLRGFEQCHFFAGIGGWAKAIELAGWRGPVWTGSCPCQPFSAAGKRLGERDKRHVWPEFRRLIQECGPATVFGEQVASKAGRDWFAGVRADLEALGYAVGAADLCAAGISAPHIRQRLFWLADAAKLSGTEQFSRPGTGCEAGPQDSAERAGPGGLADGESERRERGCDPAESAGRAFTENGGTAGGMGDANVTGSQGRGEQPGEHADQWPAGAAGESGFWSDFDVIPCLDGKARRVEPGTFPLADGVSGRVGLLRGYGNAIVPELAAEFIRACVEAKGMRR